MDLHRAIMGNVVVCRRGSLHPLSYSILHHLCNYSLACNIYLLLVGTHVSSTDPCFDPEEHLASTATLGRPLAQMKCPSNYPLGFTKYELTSSILLIPVAMAMFCTVDVFSLPFYRQLGHFYSRSTCHAVFNSVNFNFISPSFNTAHCS
jgi:hypothetical protein